MQEVQDRFTDYVGLALQIFRKKQRITQEALASGIDTDQSHISRIEKKGSSLSLDTFGRICEFLGCEPEEVFRVAKDLAQRSKMSDEELLDLLVERLQEKGKTKTGKPSKKRKRKPSSNGRKVNGR